MNFRIISVKALTRKMKMKILLRWCLYILILLLSHSLMCSGIFKTWQPYLIISLAVAVSMNEYEFSSSVFGIFCGLFLDIATGSLFGFHAILLMPICLFSSLLSRNLIKVNIINHLVITLISNAIVLMIYYVFNFLIWSVSNSDIVLTKVLLPSLAATFPTAPLMYLLIRGISRRFSLKETKELNIAVGDILDDEKRTGEEQ